MDQIAALGVAHNYATIQLHCAKIGEMFVESQGQVFMVRLLELPVGNEAGHTFHLEVDRDSGQVLNSTRTRTEVGEDSQPEGWKVDQVIDGREALLLALKAIEGYEHYDKLGRFSVEIRNETYQVTFPAPAEETVDPHSADYAYQISIDAKSGDVLKILVAS